MRHWNVRQFAAYVVVMALGTGLDVVCVAVLRRTPGVPLVMAVGAGFLANVASGYLLGRYVVFHAAQVRPSRSLWRYGVLVALNVVVAVLGVALLVSLGAPYLFARLVSSGLLVPTNYVVMRWWVFPASGRSRRAKQPRERVSEA